MTFVANWIARQYDDELSVSSPYNELHNVFRSKYGRNALGLRNALQHFAKLGELDISKGTHASQTYTIVGAEVEETPVPEILPLQTDDRVVPPPPVAANVTKGNSANDTKYPYFSPSHTLIIFLSHTHPRYTLHHKQALHQILSKF